MHLYLLDKNRFGMKNWIVFIIMNFYINWKFWYLVLKVFNYY